MITRIDQGSLSHTYKNGLWPGPEDLSFHDARGIADITDTSMFTFIVKSRN